MIKIEPFYPNSFESNSYLLINKNECVLVDPSLYNKVIKNYLDQYNFLGILITHGHYDHFMQVEAILKDYPNVKIYLHSKCYEKMKNPNLSYSYELGCLSPIIVNDDNLVYLDNKKELNISTFNFILHYLPGHTNCSIGYEIDKSIFSGDVIFKNGIGRYDLPTASYKALIESIRALSHLDKDILIYPGHEEPFTVNQIFKR